MAGKGTILLAASVVAATATAAGEGAQTRIVDRTFRCTPAVLYGGVRELGIVAAPRGTRGQGGSSFDVSTGYISVGSGRPSAFGFDLVHSRSRLEDFVNRSASLPPGVYAHARRCRAARAATPLSPKGLSGPPVRFDQAVDCEIRGRVFVRVRAVLEAPAPWRRANPPYFGARRNVVEAKIAVRSERTRRPIGFLELDRAGKTRLWVASSCG